MSELIILKEVDMTSSVPKLEPQFKFTQSPTQEELDECEKTHTLYVVMVKTLLPNKVFLTKWGLKPSDRCFQVLHQEEFSWDEMTTAVADYFTQAIEKTVWQPPVGVDRGKKIINFEAVFPQVVTGGLK